MRELNILTLPAVLSGAYPDFNDLTDEQLTWLSGQAWLHKFKLAEDLNIPEYGKWLGKDSCPLCLMYHLSAYDGGETDCVGCPIRRKTGNPYCEGTAYEAVDEFLDNGEEDVGGLIEATQQEYEFLVDLAFELAEKG